MNRFREREVRRLLEDFDREGQLIEPPAGLLEKLQAEIPEEVKLHASLVPANANTPPPRRHLWLVAATVAAMVGAGFLALRVREVAPSPESPSLKAAEPREDAGTPRLAGPPSGDMVPEGREAPEESAQGGSGLLTPGGAPPEGEARRNASPPPAPAVQPVEVPKTLSERLRMIPPPPAPPPPLKPSLRAKGRVDAVEGGVEGGVAGGVVGGVAGGVPGGVISGVPSTVTAESPLLAAARRSKPAAQPSTGGTAEPNDQPYGDVFFKTYGVNPFVDADEDRLSTFGLDVDTGSFTVIRRYLEDGNLPPHEAVRLEEVVNFFDYGDPAPARGDFAIRLEGAPNPFGPAAEASRHKLLRIGLKAREIDAERRKPSQLTFVIDISGSMDQENRLGLVKQALGLLVGQLRGDDRVGIVVFGSEARVVLEPSGDKGEIRSAINRLETEGATNTEAGLNLAYDLARRSFRTDANNRLILCSDGVANVGNTGPESILKRIGTEARKGIELSTVGFGMGNYNDVLMEQLADKGDGRYAYVDTLEEAKRIFVEGLSGTLQTIAKDAKVQVEFDPAAVQSWRLLGYENRDVADDRFRDDTVDAGEIGAGHAVTALYEIKLKPEPTASRPLATVHLRWFSKEADKVQETAQSIRLADLSATWESASPAFRLATLAGQFAEILHGSYWAKGESLGDVARRTQALVDDLPGKLRNQAIDLATLALKGLKLQPEEEPKR